MGSIPRTTNGQGKPHAVCVPFPAQGHITPMLKLAKLLHRRGFHITFVNSEFNHRRLLRSRNSSSMLGLPDFRFETIPDGLPPMDADVTQDIPSLCHSTSTNCLEPFHELVSRLNGSTDVPPVSSIISDGVMSFTLDIAEELGIPNILFWTVSGCAFLGYMHYRSFVERGITPLKDPSYLTSGYLDTMINWIPGMKSIALKDLPTFLRTTDPDDFMIKFALRETGRVMRASAVILNTFEALEEDVLLEGLSSVFPDKLYSVGPLNLLLGQDAKDDPTSNIGSNLWREESCIGWLDSKEPNSVVYVNFGSITVMARNQLVEFAWGLAGSKQEFLWVIRPDLVMGDSSDLPPEFVEETKGRGLIAGWAPQEDVLRHPSIGGFLTHCGWNSILESISSGVPVACWPFFADQQTNCRYCCSQWGIGIEIDGDVKRDVVEMQVRELMQGDAGRALRKNALEWKTKAEAACLTGGSSSRNFDRMVNEVLLSSKSSKPSY